MSTSSPTPEQEPLSPLQLSALVLATSLRAGGNADITEALATVGLPGDPTGDSLPPSAAPDVST